ncbi:MAG: hypothetical protein NTV79_02730, partial [Candidatus Aureabacteria bacterium]|nr:hypothetical protein [Candidatus Auribacterota bacterium]
LGTDQQVLATSDGGQTWAVLQSFRDDKITLDPSLGDKALRSLNMIEAIEESRARIRPETEEEEEKKSGAPTGDSAAAAAAAAAARKLQEDEAKLKQAEEEVKKQQAEVTVAQSEAAKWQPDELAASQVEGIQETGDDYVEDAVYQQLADWLQERALPVVTSPTERKRALVDYLNKHEAEGQALKAAAQAQERELAAAQGQMGSLEAQVEAAKAEKEQTDEAGAAAATAAAAAAGDQGEKQNVPGAPSEEATPVPEAEYLTGVTYLVVDPSRQERVIAATFDGIFLSADKGQTWKLVYRGTGATQSAIICLAIDPSNPANVFGGTLSGLIRSRDGGAAWERVPGIIADKVINSLAVHPFDSKVVFAGTEGYGLYRSADGGQNWEQVFTASTTEGNSIRSIAFAPSQPDLIYLGTGSGIIASSDAGKTWDKTMALGLADSAIHYLAVSPTAADTVYAATPKRLSLPLTMIIHEPSGS